MMNDRERIFFIFNYCFFFLNGMQVFECLVVMNVLFFLLIFYSNRLIKWLQNDKNEIWNTFFYCGEVKKIFFCNWSTVLIYCLFSIKWHSINFYVIYFVSTCNEKQNKATHIFFLKSLMWTLRFFLIENLICFLDSDVATKLIHIKKLKKKNQKKNAMKMKSTHKQHFFGRT